MNVGQDGIGHLDAPDEQHAVEEASAYYASIGPWASASYVTEYCRISSETLDRWREEQMVLGVEFADGGHYYPAMQFIDGHPVRGLNVVLVALAPAFIAPASKAGWLASKAYYGDPATRWDLLRAGEVELVRGWADEDTARVIAP